MTTRIVTNLVLLILFTTSSLFAQNDRTTLVLDQSSRHERKPVSALSDLPQIAPASTGSYDQLATLIEEVDQDSVEAWVRHLESLGDRLAGTESSRQARDWIYTKFLSFGLDEVRIDTGMGEQLWARDIVEIYNVVGIKYGTTQSDKVLVVGGHYDAVPGCPGADDDASGTAGTMAIAQALASQETEMTIVFIAFACEEGGVWGSRDYAFEAAERGEDIVCMFNLDMIGHGPNTDQASLWTAHETGYATLWAEIADTLVGITGHLSGSVGSDNWPFMWNGYDVVFVEEYIFSSNYHQPSDSAGNMNFDYTTRMIQGTLATMFAVANSPAPVKLSTLESTGDGQSVHLSWGNSSTPDLDHYVVYYDTDPSSNLDSAVVSAGTNETTIGSLPTASVCLFAVRVVDTDGNTSLALDWQYCSPMTSVPQFTKVLRGWPVEDGGESSGACMIDVNDDNHLDVFATDVSGFYTRGNRLYINDGEGGFSRLFGDTVLTHYSSSQSASICDIDDDGFPDITLFNIRERGTWAFFNNGNGTFRWHTDMTATSALYANGGSWADYDTDGDLDLFIANLNRFNSPSYAGANALYRNDNETFWRHLTGPVVTDMHDSYCGTWSDYDLDGDPDLLVNNLRTGANSLYRNNGGVTFTSVAAGTLTSTLGSWRGGSWADYNNDGYFDVLVTDYDGLSRIHRNMGDGTFTSLAAVTEASAWGAAWGDFDNDGDLDLFISAGDQNDPYRYQDRLLKNNGIGAFVPVTDNVAAWEKGFSKGAAFGDYDNDGDLDLYVVRSHNLHNNLYRNNGNDNHWLNVRCVGTTSNRSAIGAKVSVKAVIGGSPRWQHREVSSQTGYASQSSLRAHFGLADAETVDTLKVEWPSGIIDIYQNVSANVHFLAIEGIDDVDGDGVYSDTDNCPAIWNPGQEDTDQDGIGDACDGCCTNLTGNVDSDPADAVDLSDLTVLIDYLFISFTEPDCLEEANIDGDPAGLVDLGDLTALIDYLFITFTPPAECL